MVERWQSAPALSEPAELQITAISLDAQLDLVGFVGQPVTLIAKRADGSDVTQTRLVRTNQANQANQGTDHGLSLSALPSIFARPLARQLTPNTRLDCLSVSRRVGLYR